MENELGLTTLQKKWLNALGGRNESHVNIDEDGKYYIILQCIKQKIKKLYIPQDKDISLPIISLGE